MSDISPRLQQAAMCVAPFSPPALSSLPLRQPGCTEPHPEPGADQAAPGQKPPQSPAPVLPLCPLPVGLGNRDRRQKLWRNRPRSGPGDGEGADRGESRVVGGSVLGRRRMADAGSRRVGRLKKSLITDTFQREEENGRRSTVGLIRRKSADVFLQ